MYLQDYVSCYFSVLSLSTNIRQGILKFFCWRFIQSRNEFIHKKSTHPVAGMKYITCIMKARHHVKHLYSSGLWNEQKFMIIYFDFITSRLVISLLVRSCHFCLSPRRWTRIISVASSGRQIFKALLSYLKREKVNVEDDTGRYRVYWVTWRCTH